MRTRAEAPARSERLGVHARAAEPLDVFGFRRREELGFAEFDNGDTVLAKTRTKPVALVRYAGGEVKPFRVLNL